MEADDDLNRNHKQRESAKHSNLSLEEYLDKFDPLSDEDIGRYVPADGAVLRYSVCRIYRNSEPVGGGFRAGHSTLEDIKADPSFTRDQFSRKISLDEIEIGVAWYSYGEGEKKRDASKDEMTLACMGALDAPPGEELRYTIKRNEVELPPVSPLTERGMSIFFTEAARLAEENRFEVMGLKDDQLHIYLTGKPAIELNEGGGGTSWQYNGDQYKAFKDKVSGLWKEIKAARAAIPEILYPPDYPLVEHRTDSTLEQDGGAPSLCQY